MVTIRYFKSATSKEFESHWVNSVADFLKLKQFSKDELLDLRFFKGDVLGEEIDTLDVSFLDISNGEIEIFHGSNIPQGPIVPFLPYIFGALTFIASIALRPSIPSTEGLSQSSATNALGASKNEPRINQRTDDIFGYLPKHTPPLWQVPYRIGVNNQETEVLLVCVGRGKYAIDTDEIFDGYTQYSKIPNAQVNIYEPGTYPGNGSPSQTLGGLIDEPIGVYRESNDLNASELLPPNDLALGEDADWSISESAGTAVLTLNNSDALDVDLQDYFTVGQDILLIDTFINETSTVDFTTLYRDDGGPTSKNFYHEILTDVSGNYEITNVTSDTLTITGTSWGNYSGSFLFDYYDVNDEGTEADLFFTLDSDIESGWYQTFDDPDYSDPISWEELSKNPDVGQAFDNTIGPIVIPDGSEKIIINVTSSSGFYKIDGTTYKTIDADIEFIIEELDSDGVPTGALFPITETYSTNENNISTSVYRSIFIEVPFSRSRIYGRRLTDRDKSSGVSNVDKIEWTSLYSFESNPDNVDFGDVTLMHCVVPSNSQSRLVKERRTNLNVTRKITQYFSGGTFGPAESYATDDFSQILIHTALDPKCGRLNISQINAEGILLLKEQIINYFSSNEMIRFGYDFDTTEMSYEDMFTIVCNVVNCIPYVQNGVYDAFFEREQPTSSLQVTCRNKIAESEVREDLFYKEYDGVELTYRNEDTGVSEVIYVPSDRSAVNPERIELVGCITELQAYRRALRIRNKQIYNIVNVEFDTDEFGRVIAPGQRIDSPDGTRFVRHKGNTEGYNIYDGEVIEVNGLNVELSDPVAFVEGEDHYVQFTNANGDNSELILCTEGDNEFEIIINTTPLESIYDGYQRDKTKYTFCSEQLRESIALIPQTIEFRIDDGKETNTISSINYDSRYYQGDTETI